MKIRLYNAEILTMKSTDIFHGEIHIENDKITYVGKENKSAEHFDKELDMSGKLLMPSFKNAHTHSAMTFLRSYADDMPLQDWLFKQVFPMEAKLNADRVYTLSRLAILEYLTSGITASFDMYFEPEAYAQANIDSGFRTVLCGAVSGDNDISILEDRFVKLNKLNPLISYKLGFHAEYTAPKPLLVEVSKLAAKYKAPVFTHNSETKKEVDECIERHGMTPTQLFDNLGIYDYGGGGFHCVWFDDKDIEIFKKRNLWVVTNPASNIKLASGVAPITKMLDNGVNLCIGTDGPASNNCLDMFREMFLVTALQKLSNNDASACPAEDVLKMATTGGAKAMGLDDCDVLDEGKQADIIAIDLNQPNMQPLNNTVRNIVYSGSKQNVFMTMCAGKILYLNGEFFIGEEPQKIYEKSNQIISQMKSE